MRKKVRSTLVIDERGNVKSMYSEKMRAIVESLGPTKLAKKVSDVKFDPKIQKWVAIDRKSKKVIASDKSRKVCVEKEHAYYEKMISKGKPPW